MLLLLLWDLLSDWEIFGGFLTKPGKTGGAAFLLVYILCVLFLGLPVMLAEFVVGRSAKANVNRSFLKLAPGTHWNIIGYMGVFARCLLWVFIL